MTLKHCEVAPSPPWHAVLYNIKSPAISSTLIKFTCRSHMRANVCYLGNCWSHFNPLIIHTERLARVKGALPLIFWGSWESFYNIAEFIVYSRQKRNAGSFCWVSNTGWRLFCIRSVCIIISLQNWLHTQCGVLSYGHEICNDILIWEIITTEHEESGRKVEPLMRT